MTRSMLRASVLAALALGLIGCGQPIDEVIGVSCLEMGPIAPEPTAGTEADTTIAPSGDPTPSDAGIAPALAVGPDDILDLVIVLDSVPAGSGSVRIRVDGLAEPGLVKFFMPPPTAAAAGMALKPPATFQGCAAVAPAGLELRAPWAPHAKAWVRISTDRPVRVRPRVPNRRAEPVVVMPGTSAIVGWEA